MSTDTERALQQQVADLERENAKLKAHIKGAQENALSNASDPHNTPTPEPAGAEIQQPGPALSAKRSYKGQRALVVDDHRVNQLLAKHLLQSAGFEVDVAEDGEQAVLAVQTSQFDLVLMDLQMPKMDGWQATQLIRQWELSQAKARVPIIALTANMTAHPDDIHPKYDTSTGIDGYLRKPLTQPALQTALQAISQGIQVVQNGPVNREQLLARLAQNEAALKDMVKAFRADLRKCLKQTWAAMQLQDWAVVSAQAHALKGLLSSMTAEAAAAEARALELAARARDAAGAQAAFARLSLSAKLAFEAVKGW